MLVALPGPPGRAVMMRRSCPGSNLPGWLESMVHRPTGTQPDAPKENSFWPISRSPFGAICEEDVQLRNQRPLPSRPPPIGP